MTLEEYILDKIKNHTINYSKIPVYDVNILDIQSWQNYFNAITNNKLWLIVNIIDLNYKVLEYVDDTDPTYRYTIGLNIFGGLLEKNCCNTNPITVVDCIIETTIEYCISINRNNKLTDTDDKEVPIPIIDEALRMLGVLIITQEMVVIGLAGLIILYLALQENK